MALPDRPVVAIVGDGSALYGVHSCWSAAHYEAGPLWIVLSNGGYIVMDRLAEKHGGGDRPWPGFGEVEVATIARGFGCPARRITGHDELVAALDEVVPTLSQRREPLLLDVEIAPTTTFVP
jgi:benzoylformate decarboxylase